MQSLRISIHDILETKCCIFYRKLTRSSARLEVRTLDHHSKTPQNNLFRDWHLVPMAHRRVLTDSLSWLSGLSRTTTTLMSSHDSYSPFSARYSEVGRGPDVGGCNVSRYVCCGSELIVVTRYLLCNRLFETF